MKLLFVGILFFSCAIVDATHLFEKFPLLKEKISYVEIACLPTPVDCCMNLEKVLHHHHSIFIKRDDMTGLQGLYGGNKVRKLEFLLGDALHTGSKKIVTVGCVGSNHAVATACYARELGLKCLVMLTPQPASDVVRQNLLLDHYFGAEIQLYATNDERKEAIAKVLESDTQVSFIPVGGSVPLGSLGFVNAALELRAQIDQGIMPMPDAIYLPVGSCGTVAGLLLGMQIAGITSRVEGIVVVENERLAVIQELFTQTNELLHSFDPTIPLYKFPEQQLHLNSDFCGTVYGQPTAEGMHALTLLKEYEEITLEGTYSAKAFAALINDCQNGAIKPDQVVLFWNTYCGLDFSHLTDTVDYHELPLPVYQYFNTHQM